MRGPFEEDIVNTMQIIRAEIAYRQEEVDRMVANAALAIRAACGRIRDRIRGLGA